VLLTSEEPVVKQFLNGSRIGPIGMSEEKDQATMEAEQAQVEAGHHDGGTDDVRGVVPQIAPTPGLPERTGVRRRKDRVMRVLHTLPKPAQEGIIESLTPAEREHYGVRSHSLATSGAPSGATAGKPSGTYRPSPWPRSAGDLKGSTGSRAESSGDVADLPRSDWRSDPPPGGGS
jgi:phospholipid/cholesterol/gamma-HCH transport system ATP-binding protein